ncbi:hypothetical protein AcW1_000236 [Taiwanofungus camphoratus]|nr:hypothetical protein AcV7_000256 [Antrodia cinnamomea]KAI0963037.1 hypothetical protein AcW1_000236 [Antrodia cinnamomea]
MPVLRNVRRSRRLSRRPPPDPEFEDFDECDLQLPCPADDPSPSSSGSTLSSSVPTSTVSPAELRSSPSPDYEPPSCVARSSHSRKKQPGHIPRPPNAFMLFRSDLWAKEKIKSSVERDHRQISRIAGALWNSLPEAQRAPFKRLAEAAKQHHAELFPEYKYAPVYRKDKPVKRKGKTATDGNAARWKAVAHLLMQGVEGNDLEKEVKRLDKGGNAGTTLNPSPGRSLGPTQPSRRQGSSSKRKPKKYPSVKIEEVEESEQAEDSVGLGLAPARGSAKGESKTPVFTPSELTATGIDGGFVPTSEIPLLNLSDTEDFQKEEEGRDPRLKRVPYRNDHVDPFFSGFKPSAIDIADSLTLPCLPRSREGSSSPLHVPLSLIPASVRASSIPPEMFCNDPPSPHLPMLLLDDDFSISSGFLFNDLKASLPSPDEPDFSQWVDFE